MAAVRAAEEAIAAEAAGDKAIKKSMFKWSPDWEAASSSYSASGASFKRAKQNTDAIRVFEKASNAYVQLKVPFHAGQMLEEAAACAAANEEPLVSKDLSARAAQLFLENGTPDRAIEVWLRAAKLLDKASLLDEAAAVMADCTQVMEDESRDIFNSDAYNFYLRILLKGRKYSEACSMLDHEIPKLLKRGHDDLAYRNCLSIMIIHIASDDLVAADRANERFMSSVEGFLRSPESRSALELLDAFEAGDDAALQKTVKSTLFTFLEQEVLRLARGLGTGGVARGPATGGTSSRSAAAAVLTGGAPPTETVAGRSGSIAAKGKRKVSRSKSRAHAANAAAAKSAAALAAAEAEDAANEPKRKGAATGASAPAVAAAPAAAAAPAPAPAAGATAPAAAAAPAKGKAKAKAKESSSSSYYSYYSSSGDAAPKKAATPKAGASASGTPKTGGTPKGTTPKAASPAGSEDEAAAAPAPEEPAAAVGQSEPTPARRRASSDFEFSDEGARPVGASEPTPAHDPDDIL